MNLDKKEEGNETEIAEEELERFLEKVYPSMSEALTEAMGQSHLFKGRRRNKGRCS